MNVAVTGASGFCGGHIAQRFADSGANVTCVGRRPGPVGSFVHWDARQGRFPELTVDLVVHAAADTSDRLTAEDAWQVNCVPVEHLANLGVPFVFVSSSSAYGRSPRSPARESDPLGQGGFDSQYAASKAHADQVAAAAGAWVLRPRAVYGPGDPTLLPRLLTRVRGKRLLLPGRDVLTSVTSVNVLAAATLACLRWPAGVYNIADPDPVSRDTMAAAVVSQALGRPVHVQHVPVWSARVLARTGPLARRLDVTDYAVSQASRPLVLDLSRSAACGFDASSLVQGRPGTFSAG